MDETKLNDIIASGLVKGNTSEAVKQELFAEIIKKHGTGPLIINGRKYQPDKYAEMLARTRIREAQTAGVLRQAEAQGNDLVRVSDHSTLTAICQEFEGKIYSISGKSKKYPKLTQYTPFHPNCLHVITIWIDVAELLGYNPYEKEDAAMEQVSNERRERLVKSLEERKAAKRAKKTKAPTANSSQSDPEERDDPIHKKPWKAFREIFPNFQGQLTYENVREFIIKQPKEYAILLEYDITTQTYTPTLAKEGTKSMVSLYPVNKDDLVNKWIIHNHPDNTVFSYYDMESAIRFSLNRFNAENKYYTFSFAPPNTIESITDFIVDFKKDYVTMRRKKIQEANVNLDDTQLMIEILESLKGKFGYEFTTIKR